ncbi:Uncharacterised protein [Chlamydia trachomatis]|nr:Uncharacterised protein [Chlamydia trachomatis]
MLIADSELCVTFDEVTLFWVVVLAVELSCFEHATVPVNKAALNNAILVSLVNFIYSIPSFLN